MEVIFRPIRRADFKRVEALIRAFYREDPEGKPTNKNKIKATFRELFSSDSGGIMVMTVDKKIVGYAILVNYWSHEYGGNILHIDELFIAPAFRGHGIGSKLIQFLKREKFYDAVAIMLEVTPINKAAERLYRRMGFRKARNKFLIQEV
ncbi:GNAT family N-acetyltransferase [Patescibacteria group bacterium]|nr:GNAT family N-acetyltransferase [Patescibacteria group bacterium]MBU1673518.1 GNAT family N-acetyltransferase [Patescibacteria group bacterium]MBU1963702.1 GNAT family N-acetyltransferase [Patescibacteria group bacterium]